MTTPRPELAFPSVGSGDPRTHDASLIFDLVFIGFEIGPLCGLLLGVWMR